MEYNLYPTCFILALAEECDIDKLPRRNDLRNLAIIAHVDHGKTTMIDCLLKACSNDKITERAMDSMALEQERGITIVSKVTSMNWKVLMDIFLQI